MKYIISLIITVFLFASYSCNENVLGIEKNVNVIPMGDNSINNKDTTIKDTNLVPAQTIFRADSFSINYNEKITWDKGKQLYATRWTPAVENYSAVIDTASPAKLTMFLSATRALDSDTIPKMRKEHILAYVINTDSLILEHIYITNKNTSVCRSIIVEQLLTMSTTKKYNGNYFLQLEFNPPRQENNHLLITGNFSFKAPLMMMRQYLFFFNGDFKIFFPMK